MKLSTVKRYRRKHKLLGTLLLRNPVLVMGLDLPFVIAAATTLKNAAAMTVELFFIHMATMLVAMLTRRRLPLWIRAMVNVTVATAVMVGARMLVLNMFRGIFNSMGMYLYLMAVSSMTVLQATYLDRRARPGPVMAGALGNVAGFSLVAFVVALIREYFGNGALWGIPVPAPIRLSGLQLVFSGFILVGFLLAAARFINKKLLALALRRVARREDSYKRIHIESVETIEL